MKTNKRCIRLIFFISGILHALSSAAQSDSKTITNLADAFNKYRAQLPIENIYLSTDKSFYATNDTLWLKAYVLNADLAYTEKSGVLHLDFINGNNKIVCQRLLQLSKGNGDAFVVLDKNIFPQGWYKLRCYTNWIRNFGEDHFYTKLFNIGQFDQSTVLVNYNAVDDQKNIKVKMQISQLDRKPLSLDKMEVSVDQAGHKLYHNFITTSGNGQYDFSFQKDSIDHEKPMLRLTSPGINSKGIAFPVELKSSGADVQFLPEGGKIIAGLTGVIAFKVIGEDGLGINVQGRLINSKQQEVLKFQSDHKGMGQFLLKAEKDETYTASILFPDGITRLFTLPGSAVSGTKISISNPITDDSIKVELNCSIDRVGKYCIIGEARQTICYAAALTLNGSPVTFKLAKKLFPTGISRFILATLNGDPLNERLAFIDHHDNLNINAKVENQVYSVGENIKLDINVKDETQKPNPAVLVLSATDDGQLTDDMTTRENIWTRFMLNADLKGNIEEPAYYTKTEDKKVWNDLDNLLLTQGWADYNWQSVLTGKFNINYEAEPDFTIHGRVTNIINKPIENSEVLLLSGKPSYVRKTITDRLGTFNFTALPQTDTPRYFIQATNRNGKSFNVGINVTENKAPPLPMDPINASPWFVNTDSIKIGYANTRLKEQALYYSSQAGNHLLKEVVIKAKKVVKGSHNLIGPGESDYALDEKDLENKGKGNLLTLLEQIKGFHVGSIPGPAPAYFFNLQIVYLVVDGQLLDNFLITNYEGYRDWLKSQSLEDIKGVEVINNKAMEYESRYLDSVSNKHAFIEITTRSGSGPNIPFTPGTYLYKPIPFAVSKSFYQPKYDTTQPSLTSNTNPATIYWNPSINTDQAGHYSLSFSAGNLPTTYSVYIEGSDLNGGLGYQYFKIKVK
jgi:hypothetical protein